LVTSIADHALEAYLTDTRARVDVVLERWSRESMAFWPHPVPDAVQYSVLSAGKRLRPTLVFAAYEALGGVDVTAGGIAELAAAVEVVHAYSLVHDDLPCMDNDDLRRGRPTVHRAFDVGAATSAGFHMVGLAARVLASGLEALRLEPDRRQSIALELFRAAGAGGMIGGQVLDLEAERSAIAIDALREVHQRKTGALIAAACVIGGLAAGGGAPLEHLTALRAYGEAIGLAFQIADDILDATATSAQLGKTAGRDAALAKSTFVSVLGVGAARAEAERLSAQAVDRLRQAALVSPTLVALANYIVTRTN
jgi:geranylgeranyl diphosphate synthase, type II